MLSIVRDALLRSVVALSWAATAGVGCSLAGLDSEYGVDGATGAEGGGDACNRPENCTNGVDDNCDGLVDCADPECTGAGYACTAAAVQSGWTFVAYSATTRPVCPASYGAQVQAVIGKVAGQAASCSCSCSGTEAVCGGNVTLQAYPSGCTSDTNLNLPVNDGICSETSVPSGYSFQLANPASQPIQGTCSGSGIVANGPPTPTFDMGATCGVSTSLGAGCGAGACAPPTGASFKPCIVHPGNVACPQLGFTQQILVSTGNPGYVDTRACSDCPCGTSLQCGLVRGMGFWSDKVCNGGGGGGQALSAGATCGPVYNAIGSYQVQLEPTGSAKCQATGSSTATGNVTLDQNVETICCPP
jgi:hypothetical protein